MSKILGSWSGMRKYLENEMLAPSLSGRVRYHCTSCKGMDDFFVFSVFVDKVSVKKFSWETVNSYFIDSGYKQNKNPRGQHEYWEEFHELLNEYPMSKRDEFTDDEFCHALKNYRNQTIEKSLNSENAIERMFAILDYRVGKRTLIKLAEQVENQPQWLQVFYNLRLTAENIQS